MKDNNYNTEFYTQLFSQLRGYSEEISGPHTLLSGSYWEMYQNRRMNTKEGGVRLQRGKATYTTSGGKPRRG